MFGIIIKGCDFMQFEVLTIEEYLTFFNSFKYSHFLQSVTWGLVNKETRNKEPIFVGLKKDNKVLAAALLLKRKCLLIFVTTIVLVAIFLILTTKKS